MKCINEKNSQFLQLKINLMAKMRGRSYFALLIIFTKYPLSKKYKMIITFGCFILMLFCFNFKRNFMEKTRLTTTIDYKGFLFISTPL